MLINSALLLLTICISLSTALKVIKSGEYCFGACQLSLQSVKFNDTTEHTPKYERLCGSKLRIDSLYLCVRLYCTLQNAEKGLDEWNQTCQDRGNVTLPPIQVVAHYTDADVVRLGRVRREEADDNILSKSPMLPDERLFRLSHDTLVECRSSKN
jgi:hypothetical protein